jgi:hypothetical protein
MLMFRDGSDDGGDEGGHRPGGLQPHLRAADLHLPWRDRRSVEKPAAS